jgi:CRP-like cAMP-binding protein
VLWRLYHDACLRHLLATHTAQCLVLYDVETRLLRLLLDLAQRFGHIENDTAHIDRRVTVTILTEALGLNRKTLSRSLAQLEQDGTIDRDAKRGTIAVRRLADLERRLPRPLLGLSSSIGEASAQLFKR